MTCIPRRRAARTASSATSWSGETDPARDAAVLVAAGVVIIVAVGSQPVTQREDARHRGLPSPLASADPERAPQGPERVPIPRSPGPRQLSCPARLNGSGRSATPRWTSLVLLRV